MKQLFLCLFVSLSYAQEREYEKVIIKSENEEAVFYIDKEFPPERRKDIIADLQGLASIPLQGKTSPLHKKIFKGEVSGDTYLKYLAKNMSHFRMRRDGEHEDVADSTAFNLGNGKAIYLNWDYFLLDKDYRRWSVLLHEARHTPLFDKGHKKCPKRKKTFKGFFWEDIPEDKYSNCDRAPYGAHFYEMVFRYNIKDYLSKRMEILRFNEDYFEELLANQAGYVRHRKSRLFILKDMLESSYYSKEESENIKCDILNSDYKKLIKMIR